MSDTLITIVASILMVRFVAMEASYQRAKWIGSGLRFPVGIMLRILLRCGGAIGIYAGYRVFKESATGGSSIAAILGVLLGIACILGEPGEISTSPGGIKQKRFLGLKIKMIPWERAVASCMSSPERIHEILVIGGNGTTITHTQYHVAQKEFLRELQRYNVFIQGYSGRL
jgi:hypothetical protein